MKLKVIYLYATDNILVVKSNIRTIGIDDAAFQRKNSSKTFVFGVVVRGHNLVEGVLRTDVEIDGMDASDKICNMITESKFHNQLKAIFLGSSTIGAFNIIDLNLLYRKTSLPIIIVLSNLPNNNDVKEALSHLPDWKNRYDILMSNPPIQKIEFVNQIGRKCDAHIQQIGFDDINTVRNILKITTYSSAIPECLRLADMIGRSFKNFII